MKTSFAELDLLSSDWDETVSRLGSPVYMTFDWVKTWWEFYGEGKELRLFLFHKSQALVAIFPMYIESFGIGPLRTKVARLIGANIPPKTFNPPVDQSIATEALSRMLTHLLATDSCDLVSFGPISESWSGRLYLSQALEQLADLVGRSQYRPRDVQTWFELPLSFEAYLQTLSSSERKNRMKRIRHLEKNHQVSSDIVADPVSVEAEFDAFVRQHSAQWQAIGKSGHFAAWPRGEAYNRALVRAQARCGRVRFFRMLVDGQVVSNRYTFLLGSTLFSELPARACGEPWDKLGIGGISLLKFNESAIQAGVRAIDSGLGAYEHKASLGGDQVPVGTWQITGKGLSSARARLFLLVAGAVTFVCHKLWYRRLLPHMPQSFRRTQSLAWLRFGV